MWKTLKDNCAFYLLSYLPILIPIGIGIICIYLSNRGHFQINETIISNSLTVSSILTGFLGVVYSLIIAFYDSEVIAKLRKLSISLKYYYYDVLITYLNIALLSGLFFLGFCLIFQFFLTEYKQSNGIRCMVNGFWFFLISCQLVYFYKSISAMFSLLSKKK